MNEILSKLSVYLLSSYFILKVELNKTDIVVQRAGDLLVPFQYVYRLRFVKNAFQVEVSVNVSSHKERVSTVVNPRQ